MMTRTKMSKILSLGLGQHRGQRHNSDVASFRVLRAQKVKRARIPLFQSKLLRRPGPRVRDLGLSLGQSLEYDLRGGLLSVNPMLM